MLTPPDHGVAEQIMLSLAWHRVHWLVMEPLVLCRNLDSGCVANGRFAGPKIVGQVRGMLLVWGPGLLVRVCCIMLSY